MESEALREMLLARAQHRRDLGLHRRVRRRHDLPDPDDVARAAGIDGCHLPILTGSGQAFEITCTLLACRPFSPSSGLKRTSVPTASRSKSPCSTLLRWKYTSRLSKVLMKPKPSGDRLDTRPRGSASRVFSSPRRSCAVFLTWLSMAPNAWLMSAGSCVFMSCTTFCFFAARSWLGGSRTSTRTL